MEQKSVAKNTAYLSFSYIIQKLLSFLYFVLVARFIGVEDVGKYTFALSFTTMFAVFIDFGLTSTLIREAAKTWDKSGKFLSSIIGIKTFFSLLVYLIVVIAINLLGYPELTKNLVYLSGLIMVLDSFTLSLWGVFRGGQNLRYEAVSVIINQLLIVAIGVLVLILRLPLPFLMLPFICGSLFSLIFSAYLLKVKLKIKLSWRLDGKVIKFLFKISIPLALIAIFSRIYGYIDQILVSYLKGDEALGWYATAMKIPFALQFIPAAFAAAIFPAFSGYFSNNKEQLRKSFERAMVILTILAIPVSFGIFCVAGDTVLLVFGERYWNSVLPLQILMAGLIFVFLNFPLGSLMNGCDRQVTNTKLVGGIMILNIILNIFLIPKYSFVGAAAAFVVCHGLLFIFGMIIARQIVEYRVVYVVKVIAKSILCAGLMAVFLMYTKQFVNFLWLIPVSAGIYFGLMYLIKGLDKADICYLVNSVLKRHQKV